MKKSIRKPVNWQDFESLCKMLWGEIWNIQDKIKKNGRLGQPQAGVDIYGIPANKKRYTGIQCKGKDDYAETKLTEKEVDEEIEKAKAFQPPLETFIFATTANKDVLIEEYIRKKDIESRQNGGFEILLYCWEDIADLIETNRHTFNYYVLENQFKENFGIDVKFSNGETACVVHPKFKKVIRSCRLKPIDPVKMMSSMAAFHNPLFNSVPWMMNVNNSWTSFEICFTNTGAKVLEDFRLYVSPEKHKFRNLSGFRGSIADRVDYLRHSSYYVFEDEKDDEKYAIFRHKDNAPLIQKDSRSFELDILTDYDTHELKIFYELLARDFNQEGELVLRVEPEYEIEENILWVDHQHEILDTICDIKDLMTRGSAF